MYKTESWSLKLLNNIYGLGIEFLCIALNNVNKYTKYTKILNKIKILYTKLLINGIFSKNII